MHCVKPLDDNNEDMATTKISKFFSALECWGVVTLWDWCYHTLPIKALSLEIILSQFSDNPDLKNFVRSKFWGQFLSSQRNIEWIRMAADTTSGNIWINHLDSFTFNNWPEAIKIIQTFSEWIMLYCTKSKPKTIFLTFILLPKQLKNFGYISYFYAFPYFWK